MNNIHNLLKLGKVLIFVNHIATCTELAKEIKLSVNIEPLVLHGDKYQQERTQIINSFKKNNDLLIATDIASRG